MLLIKQAQQSLTESSIILSNIQALAAEAGVPEIELKESISHVLAGLGETAKNMHPRSVAALLAGVEKLSSTLPTDKNKTNTIRSLASAAMKFDDVTKESLPNQAVVTIAQYGSNFPELVQKYSQVAASGDSQQIDKAARVLIAPIERAIRLSSQSSSPAPAANPLAIGQPA